MKYSLLVMALGALMMPLAGCETLTLTSAEHGNEYIHVVDTNVKQIPDDVDRLLLLDRPSWLSKDPIPNN